MAAITLGVATPDTGTQPNTSGSFTPAVGDFLLVFVSCTATAEAAPTLTSSVGGFTFSLLYQQTFRTDLDKLYVFAADAFVSSASSQTVQIGTTDDFTGSNIVVVRVSGLSSAGAGAIVKEEDTNGGGANTPETVWGSGAASASNPVISVVANGTNPATMTEPSGWNELADIGHASPNHGMSVAYLNSGFSSDTVTWGSTGGTAFAIVSLELSAAAAGITRLLSSELLKSQLLNR